MWLDWSPLFSLAAFTARQTPPPNTHTVLVFKTIVGYYRLSRLRHRHRQRSHLDLFPAVVVFMWWQTSFVERMYREKRGGGVYVVVL
ncbi:hypothetical protein Hanom_Chr12g01138521 [Helianthus anomalus]